MPVVRADRMTELLDPAIGPFTPFPMHGAEYYWHGMLGASSATSTKRQLRTERPARAPLRPALPRSRPSLALGYPGALLGFSAILSPPLPRFSKTLRGKLRSTGGKFP